MKSDYRISIDVGGTFTDAILVTSSGARYIGKSLTTPDRAFSGISGALGNIGDQLGVDLSELLENTTQLIYGTTRATNAIVTRGVARTAFITTAGFPDILVMKEGGKTHAHDFNHEYPDPYISRHDTFEVGGRINRDGEVVKEFDERGALEVVSQIKATGFESVGVCFLWSFVNPDHELKMGRLLTDNLPNVAVTLSCELNPILREYRRASSVVIDASLKPMMQSHLRALEKDLKQAGLKVSPLVSTSAGGLMTLAEVVEKPIHMAKSGPAMAPVAAKSYAELEFSNSTALVCDTGGTTFDVGLVRDGRLAYTQESWLGGRWVGDILGMSSVDIRSLGAGGGSIIWMDDGGLARVGPHSAGASPGPACYGQGGQSPTISDAACVLGYLNPNNFLGGRMQLDVDAARDAIKPLAERMGQSIELTAYKSLQLAAELMMDAIRDVTISEGYDPRKGVLVAGGGAAGTNIMLIAKELRTRELVIPKEASALSAMGMQFANIVREESCALITNSDRFESNKVKKLLTSFSDRLRKFANDISLDSEKLDIRHFVKGRYSNQVWELEIELDGPLDDAHLQGEHLLELFHKTHERVYGNRDPNTAVEFSTWISRLSADIGIEAANNPSLSDPNRVGRVSVNRPCWFGGENPIPTPIYSGSDLVIGERYSGPCIIEEPTTTIVVYQGMEVEISENGNYLIKTGLVGDADE